MHGGLSTGPYTKNGKAVGFFARALKEDPELAALMTDLEESKKEGGNKGLRQNAIDVQAVWIARALKTVAVPQHVYRLLEKDVNGHVIHKEITNTQGAFVLSRLHGPDLYELSRANQTLFQGIKDHEDPGHQLLQMIVTAIFTAKTLEQLQQMLIDNSIGQTIDSAYKNEPVGARD